MDGLMNEVRTPSPSPTHPPVEENSYENRVSLPTRTDQNTIRERRLRALNIPETGTSEQSTPNPIPEETQPPPNPTVMQETEAEPQRSQRSILR